MEAVVSPNSPPEQRWHNRLRRFRHRWHRPTDVSLHESLDYSRQLLAASCTTQSVPRCHYIDPVVELAGKIRSDGIHPTDEGYDILGQMAWDMMQAEGMRR